MERDSHYGRLLHNCIYLDVWKGAQTRNQRRLAIEGDKSVLSLEQLWLPTEYTTITQLHTPETGERHSLWAVLRCYKWSGISLPALKRGLCWAVTRIGAVQPS